MTELQLFYTSEEMEVINQSAYLQGWHDGHNVGFEEGRESYAPCRPLSLETEYEIVDGGGSVLATTSVPYDSESVWDGIDNRQHYFQGHNNEDFYSGRVVQACGRNDKDCGANGGSARCDGCKC